jgi:hypothetical protein
MHVACSGDRRGGEPEVKRPHEYSGIDGRVILKWHLKEWDERASTGMPWLRINEQEACSCEFVN